MKPWALVSPASRGIGFCIARRILQTTTCPVVVTARTKTEDLKSRILDGLDIDSKRLNVLKLDFLDESTVSEAASKCKDLFPPKDNLLHLAFVIPGILHPEKAPRQISYDDALQTFQTNTLGPLLFIKHFSSFLPTARPGSEKGESNSKSSPELYRGLDPNVSRHIFMSARVGSITDNRRGGWYSYRSSKAAVNQLVKTYDLHMQNTVGDQAMAIAMHPGTVKTGLSEEFWDSTPKAQLFEPEFVAERLVDLNTSVEKSVGLEGRGKCWDYDNKEVPP